MSKRPGSKASRSERRAGRERAQRARERGLPEIREPAPLRARAATPEPSSGNAVALPSNQPARKERTQLIPTPLKLLGIAIVLLIGVYFLSQKRDEALRQTPAAPEPLSAMAAPAPPPASSVSEPP